MHMFISSKRNILVVEDDSDIRSLLEAALSLEGYEVETAVNGQEAWEVLHRTQRRPSAIVLDLMMPVMDGWRFLELQAQSDELKDIPTVIVSATSEQKIPNPKQNQVVLRKPIDLTQFLDCIDRLSQ